MTKRLLEIENTALFGSDAILVSLSGREEISRPFEFSLTISSPKENIKPEEVIGQPLGVRIDRGDAEPRYIHGYISHLWAGDFSMSEDQKSLPRRSYRVRLVPWLWFMTRAARCFVYLPEKKEKSIQDTLNELIKRVKSYGHVETWIDDSAASILKSRMVEHCVQYRETDFNFFSRTLERFGVYYYFKHEKDKHTLVLSDKNNYPTAIESEIEYAPSIGGQMNIDRLTSWEHIYEFVSGKLEQTDYDFLQPSTNLKVSASKHGLIPLNNNTGYELYDYSNDYVRKGDGRTEAERRLEEEEIRFNSVAGGGSCKTLTAGYTFKLTKHHSCPSEQGKSFLLTSVSHSASQPGPFTSGDVGQHYSNQFLCVPKDMQYRPQRVTPLPVLSSVQTAMVVGPAGEEIYTDEYGRVKVQFHWDREGKHDENTSCWVRVTQVHAGKGFGGIDIPRVGEEVVVSFLDGDPDRPLITGRVYHKESMPPFSLPGEKTRSGLKSKTYKGSGYNELSLDDTPGKEQIRIHGQYNMDTVVENDETHHIKMNRTKTVDVDETNKIGKNQNSEVGVDKSTKVGNNHDETIGVNQTVNVGTNQSTSVGANQSTSVGTNQSNSVGMNQSNSVGMMKNETVGIMSSEAVGVTKSLAAGFSYGVSVGISMSTQVGDSISESSGGASSEDVGTTKSINAGDEVAIVCGAAKFVMKKDGSILIEGKDIVIKATDKITAKASGDMVLKAAKIGQN